MSAPRLEACYFGEHHNDQWRRLARVLAWTAARHCPGWAVRVGTITPAPVAGQHSPAYIANTQKLGHWTQLVLEAKDGDRLALLDVDTAILRPLDEVWARPFDLAYTVKADHFPLNAGVVFLRVSDRVRQFMVAWREENARMLGDEKHHRIWRHKYGGINQAALGAVLESPRTKGLALAHLSCLEWNCENFTWRNFNPAVTRIVHVKSALRRSIFSAGPGSGEWRPLVKLWRDLEREALQAAGPPTARHDDPNTERLSEQIIMHLSKAEYDAICRRALRHGISLSKFSRLLLLRYVDTPSR